MNVLTHIKGSISSISDFLLVHVCIYDCYLKMQNEEQHEHRLTFTLSLSTYKYIIADLY